MNHRPFLLQHPCGISITQALRAVEVQGIPGVKWDDMKTGYCWYHLPRTFMADSWVASSLCFKGPELTRVSLAVVDSAEVKGSWADWSENAELKRVEDTRAWFGRIGFPVGEYDWGSVYVAYDPKGGSGGGGVTFRDR